MSRCSRDCVTYQRRLALQERRMFWLGAILLGLAILLFLRSQWQWAPIALISAICFPEVRTLLSNMLRG